MPDNPATTRMSNTRRHAILLLLSGVIAKMAHADEKGNLPNPFMSSGTVVPLSAAPMGITLNLDSFTGITVTMGSDTVTITSAELFKALANG